MRAKGKWKNIGEYVHYRRMRAGLTYRQLAEASGLTSTLIFNVEAGNSDPKFTSLEKLAEGFDEPTLKFLRGFYLRRR